MQLHSGEKRRQILCKNAFDCFQSCWRWNFFMNGKLFVESDETEREVSETANWNSASLVVRQSTEWINVAGQQDGNVQQICALFMRLSRRLFPYLKIHHSEILMEMPEKSTRTRVWGEHKWSDRDLEETWGMAVFLFWLHWLLSSQQKSRNCQTHSDHAEHSSVSRKILKISKTRREFF